MKSNEGEGNGVMKQAVKGEEPLPVLVAEDNTLMRQVLSGLLREAGCRVTAAANGREALELFALSGFRVVFTDWLMPEIDGIELCRTIRGQYSEREVYLVLLTSRDSREDVAQGLEAGADEYLVKPVRQTELNACLKTARRILRLESSLEESREEVDRLARHDPLTGLFNRPFLDERLPQEIKRAWRYGHALCLILLDVDELAKINRTYGEQTGDLVLKDCANLLRESVRNDLDWLARYGEDRFLLVLPETDLTGATVIAERLRRRLAGGHGVPVTASMGVAGVVPREGLQPPGAEELLLLAERGLFRAKCAGRNRVEAVSFPATRDTGEAP